jgi:hypothetical protein
MIDRREVALAFDTVADVARELAAELRKESPDYTRAADLTQRVAVLWECAASVSTAWMADALVFGLDTAGRRT